MTGSINYISVKGPFKNVLRRHIAKKNKKKNKRETGKTYTDVICMSINEIYFSGVIE